MQTLNMCLGKTEKRATIRDTSSCTLPASVFSSGGFLTSYDLSNKQPPIYIYLGFSLRTIKLFSS